MNEIVPSPAERSAGRLADHTAAVASEWLRRDGFVVLADVISGEHIQVLRDRMIADVDQITTRKDAPFNWNRGNLQQDPPPFPPFLFRDVLVNEFAIQVTKSILGNGMKSFFYSGNTALKSESRQPVHADSGQLWPHLDTVHPAYQLVVNVPVVDMDERNGSTEIWSGTHLDPSIVMQDGDIKVPNDLLEARRLVSPPFQPSVRAGSIVIRDIRLWHAGMPNRTDVPRPMIAMIHSVSWMPTSPLRFPKGTEALFAHPDLHTHAVFVDEEIDYIAAPHGFEFAET